MAEIENPEPQDTDVSEQVEDVEIDSESSTESGDVESAATEQPEEPGPEGDTQATEPPPTGVQKRINELTAKRREAERDAEYWKDRALSTPQEPKTEAKQPAQATPAPKVDDFDSYEEFIPAAIEHGIQSGLAKVKDSIKNETREDKRMREIRDFHAKGTEVYPDFVDKLSKIPVTEPMGEAIVGSEKGTEIAYHLAQNPKLAQELAQLSPVAAAMEIGKLEVTLSTKTKEPPPPNPKPPLKTVDGRKVTTPDIYDPNLSVDDYAKARGYP